ncbi:L-2-hydroxyglutarate oxidase LhgO [Rhizobium sp. BK529]|uniref:NAD(P)/FAD-dependent oxidoreductase n=1 Tax=unclassified Rhizobium TaxID=2613769 RepID=UPI001047DA6A|nr:MULTISPECIES: NAD(P)/FAD-dependent oxidoreductase [unclassified Rhizobium]MBB3591235.1 L-2-hydroxyglutarate oxidase LhgO [Rhizobium sp. BK529]TCS08810.1 L-2-hydroxyglutarate oxidase LhgO [Rhizobium sp. BK418]
MAEVLDLDCVVVGGGVVGLAVARELTMKGRQVVLLEAEPMTGSITSARNSEVIHAGLYYATGSLKAQLCVVGKHKLYEYCRERRVPHRACGKLVVATSEQELGYLEKLSRQAEANGVEDCYLIDAAELFRREPEIRGVAALVSPSTGIVDSHSLMQAYITDVEADGGTIVCNSPVIEGEFTADKIRLSVGGRDPVRIEAGLVVNAAGLNAWTLSERLSGLDASTIPPRYYAKGCYFALAGRAPAKQLIYPVPEPGGLGVHLTLDLAGQARFGPDVEWVEAIDYDVDPSRADKFYSAIRRYWPDLVDGALQPAYSGIRPKIAGPAAGGGGDFVIQGPEQTRHPGYVALYGIESPGLTASLAIGQKVARLAG